MYTKKQTRCSDFWPVWTVASARSQYSCDNDNFRSNWFDELQKAFKFYSCNTWLNQWQKFWGNTRTNYGEKKSSYKRFTYKEKKQILDKSERLGFSAVCLKYNIPSSTFYDWEKNKQIIFTSCKKFGNTKRACKPFVHERDEAIITWLPGALKKGVPAAGPVLKQKAVEVNKQLGGPTKFSASNGWLHKL